MAEQRSIETVATVARVSTLADNGLRVAFDLPEDAIYQVAWLLQVRAASGAVRLRIELAEAAP